MSSATATERRRLTLQELAIARHRWEHDRRDGFKWLAAEIATSWRVAVTRDDLRKAADSQGWKKGHAT